MKKDIKGKVLQFRQDGDFFFRRGLSKLDENKLLDAMAYYRRALELDPDNGEIKLAMAETYTEMYRYEESNRLLFTFFSEGAEEIPSECYYGMGVNFIGLREYDRARDSFEKYLETDPEGEFAYDAYDMLDAMDDHAEEIAREMEDDSFRTSRELLMREDFDKAIEELQRIVDEDPEDLAAYNNMALAYYCKRDFERAAELSNMVLEKDKDNIQAHCNLSVFAHGRKDEAGEKREGDYLAAAKIKDPDALNRAALTLMELGRYGDALPLMRQLFRISPYDAGTTHRLAMCCYKVGEYKRAMHCYDRLLKLNSRDSVALYYRNICRIAAEGGESGARFNIHYEVPVEEVIDRIRRINRLVNSDRKELDSLWQEGDAELMMLVYWALDFSENSIKRAMLFFVASFEDERAEDILRDFLLQDGQPTSVKQEVFGMLKHNGAKEPYLAYLDGQLVESRVNIVELPSHRIPRSYNHVVEYCLTLMHGERPEACLQGAVRIWAGYIKLLGEKAENYPRLNRAQVFALAAALEYLSCQRGGLEVTKTELCRKYGVTLTRFNNALARIAGVRTEE